MTDLVRIQKEDFSIDKEVQNVMAASKGIGGVVVFLVDHALHSHLADRLVHRLDADARFGQRPHPLGEAALDRAGRVAPCAGG